MPIKNKKLYWIIVCLVFLFMFGILYCCKFPSIIFQSACKEFDLNETAIVLGAVAAFAGLLIPLHYALVLDIIEKMKNIKESEEITWLKSYCHTSDIIVFLTALFGVSSLFEGAFALGFHFQVIKVTFWWNKILGFCYIFIVGYSVGTSYLTLGEDWGLKYEGKPYNIYLRLLGISSFISVLWAKALIFYKTPSHTAFLALFLLSFFYFLWLFLRAFFKPMSRIAKISLE